MMADLEKLYTHFAFGKNWLSYSDLISEAEIDHARKGMLKLVPAEQIAGKSLLDIGCGSGIHALVALELGAARVQGVDLDPNSVAAATKVLSRSPHKNWKTDVISVFDLDPVRHGTFDIVYSWGVLHHTGSMWKAIDHAAAMVAPGGLLVIALYRKTHSDALWKIEKRIYSAAPGWLQAAIQSGYLLAVRAAYAVRGINFKEHVASYKTKRGMDFYHDMHDWLGGYPYETASPAEVEAALTHKGFRLDRAFTKPTSLGLLGAGCDEYVYRAPAGKVGGTPA